MAAEPEIARAFDLYVSCRSFQLFTVDIPKGSGKSQTIMKKIMPFPVGITSYPEAGGLLDQSYRMWEFFEIFLSAERQAVFNNLR